MKEYDFTFVGNAVLRKNQEGVLRDPLLKDLDVLRKMRNKLHIGGVEAVTKKYTKRNVEFAVEVLEKTMRAVV